MDAESPDAYLDSYLEEMLSETYESSHQQRVKRRTMREQQLQQQLAQRKSMPSQPYFIDVCRFIGTDLRRGHLNLLAWLTRKRTAVLPEMLDTLRHATHRYIPNHTAGPVAWFPGDKVFVGQFSKDGETFVSAAQGQTIRLFETQKIRHYLAKAPHAQAQDPDREGHLSPSEDSSSAVLPVDPFKAIHARDVGWSILDVDFSPDQQFLIYSSWSNYIHLCNVHGNADVHEALDLQPASNRHFCAFSIRFSPDNREVVAGTSEYALYVYDIPKGQRVLKIQAHQDDINTVAFGDDWSSHIIFSGADDGICKVWDRRCMTDGVNPQPVGCLVGHTDGIVYVASRGDGRYVATSSKDQTIKLFDIRQMGARDVGASIKAKPYIPQWDYRYSVFPRDLVHPVHPDDMSVMTYRGHCVLQTLIRCHFSPAYTTGHRYIYSGSHDGGVYIYDALTGNIVRRLMYHKAVTRDVSWHPYLPLLISTSWDGSHVAFDCQQPEDGPEEPEILPSYWRPGDPRRTEADAKVRSRTHHPPVKPTQLVPVSHTSEDEEEEPQRQRQPQRPAMHQYQQARRLHQLYRLLRVQYEAERAQEQEREANN